MGVYGSPMSQESGCSFSRTTGEYMRASATSASDAGAAEAAGAVPSATARTASAPARTRTQSPRAGRPS